MGTIETDLSCLILPCMCMNSWHVTSLFFQISVNVQGEYFNVAKEKSLITLPNFKIADHKMLPTMAES
jgi:hypothetical protein